MSEIMKKVELLSPAGSYESALAGIQNGCDAIYLAGSRFGARAFASNFSNEEMIEMIRYAHAYGVKVYITLNTLVHDEECAACFDYIHFLYDADVDAVIVQDLGILYYIRSHYPDFEVHASTQMHIVNENALSLLSGLGVSRAVLARETTIEEIRRFAKQDIELEVFVHGALCVSYSGQCLMSSMIGGRSGNRGECAQTCRMPYTLSEFHSKKEYDKPAYLLSLMDLNTLEDVPALMEANVASFKIEGRMKKSEYVAHITSLYRKKIDDHNYQISEEELLQAKTLFHRGYTSGFLKSQKGSRLYNPYRPNHIGITVGEVVAYQNNRAKIRLSEKIHQADGIRILNDKADYGFKVNRLYVNGLLANQAEAGMIVEIECYEMVYKGSQVVKTSDPIMDKRIRASYEHNTRRINIYMEVFAQSNQPLILKVRDHIHTIELSSENVLEVANKRATTKEEIIRQLNKVNDTIFNIESVDVKMQEALFIPIKVINQLRRDALNKLYELRSKDIRRVSKPFTLKERTIIPLDTQLNVKVWNEEQLLTCLNLVDYIYTSDKTLYEQYTHTGKVKLCSSKIEKDNYEQVSMIQEIGGIHALDTFECDTSLNVYNAHTLYFLQMMNASLVTFSYELKVEEIIVLMKEYQKKYNTDANTQFVAYGRVEVMVSEHCPINATILDNDKQNCQLCRKKCYALKDKFNNYFPMHNDEKCRMHLYDYKIMNHLGQIKEVLKAGVKAIRLDFSFESKEEMITIINEAKRYMK